jgi:putative ABC transport system permease protein
LAKVAAGLTDGAKLQEDGIVLERSFARVLGVHVGSLLTFTTPDGTLSLPVIGMAISPSQSRYPRSNPGLGWVTETSLDQIEPDRSNWHWQQAIRLADPSLATAFAGKIAAAFPTASFYAQTWQEQRNDALNDSSATRLILTTYTVLLLMVLYSVTAILVSERANKQYREIGLLKAVGFTPKQISTIFLLESASLGVLAVIIGSLLGIILAPVLAAPSAETLLDSPSVAANPSHILMAAAAILPVLLVSAILSTLRSTRFSVLQTIRAGTTRPFSRSRIAQAITKSPSLPLCSV